MKICGECVWFHDLGAYGSCEYPIPAWVEIDKGENNDMMRSYSNLAAECRCFTKIQSVDKTPQII